VQTVPPTGVTHLWSKKEWDKLAARSAQRSRFIKSEHLASSLSHSSEPFGAAQNRRFRSGWW